MFKSIIHEAFMSDVLRRASQGMDAITRRGPLSPLFRIPIGLIIAVELLGFGLLIITDPVQPNWLPARIVSQHVFGLYCMICGATCVFTYRRVNVWGLIVLTLPFVMVLGLTFLGIVNSGFLAVTTGTPFNWRPILGLLVYGGLYYGEMLGADFEHKYKSK